MQILEDSIIETIQSQGCKRQKVKGCGGRLQLDASLASRNASSSIVQALCTRRPRRQQAPLLGIFLPPLLEYLDDLFFSPVTLP